MFKHIAKERTDDEKKEIYEKWHKLINMTQKELNSWGDDPDHLLASLNRNEAKDMGKIQSGYDSFHRIKRRKEKPYKDWSAEDFDNATQENGFNSRMLGGNPGDPVENTGMSKWEISLRNWGHDPSKSSSPSYDKWKKWDEKHNKKKKASVFAKELLPIAIKYNNMHLKKACSCVMNDPIKKNILTMNTEILNFVEDNPPALKDILKLV